MKDFITKSFMNKSRGSVDHNDDQDNYMESGKVHYKHLSEDEYENKASILTENHQMADQERIDIDY